MFSAHPLPELMLTRSFDVFFDLRLNKPLSKQWWGWWFETLSRPLLRHCNEWVFKNTSQWNVSRNSVNFHQKNAFDYFQFSGQFV